MQLKSSGPSPCSSAGFTLIELLVVMLIIGILATAISLSVGGRTVEDRMQAESRRLEQLMQLAVDESLAKGLDFGFRQTHEGFEFMTPNLQSGGWAVVQEGLFRPRQLPPPFVMELRVDDRVVDPVDPALPGTGAGKSESDGALELDEEKQSIEPQVLILSSGEATAFTLDLKMQGHPAYYRLRTDNFGQTSTERVDEFDR